MSSDRRTPHVIRRERPARATTPIAAPQLEELVEELRGTGEPAFELPDADPDVDVSVTPQDPAVPPQRFAHLVRRSTK
ncbi:MAG: hypothetical protein IPQ07_14750 [Myxococcales bacterium]|nr:hypothetical protein [Myxococcales bacterium]